MNKSFWKRYILLVVPFALIIGAAGYFAGTALAGHTAAPAQHYQAPQQHGSSCWATTNDHTALVRTASCDQPVLMAGGVQLSQTSAPASAQLGPLAVQQCAGTVAGEHVTVYTWLHSGQRANQITSYAAENICAGVDG